MQPSYDELRQELDALDAASEMMLRGLMAMRDTIDQQGLPAKPEMLVDLLDDIVIAASRAGMPLTVDQAFGFEGCYDA